MRATGLDDLPGALLLAPRGEGRVSSAVTY
jgi:hypothetical protein